MGQRLLAALVVIFGVMIVLGRSRPGSQASPPPAPQEAGSPSARPRELTLKPHPDVGAPAMSTPTIDMLAVLALRRKIVREGSRVYIDALLAETDSTIVRWPDRLNRTYTVAFYPDTLMKGWSADVLNDARAGMQAWSGNSAALTLQETTDTLNADISVHWLAYGVRQREAGATQISWASDGVITRANMSLALRFADSTALSSTQRRRTATHEFGHALGLPHSPEPGDLMFARTESDSPQRRDFATLLLLYSLLPGSLRLP